MDELLPDIVWWLVIATTLSLVLAMWETGILWSALALK